MCRYFSKVSLMDPTAYGRDELDDVLSVAVARLRLAAPGGTILS
jgi:hypothetical protein